MIHVKKFIDKVSLTESKQSKDFVMTMTDARGLRDELSKLLADLYQVAKSTQKEEQVMKVEIKGGSFK